MDIKDPIKPPTPLYVSIKPILSTGYPPKENKKSGIRIKGGTKIIPNKKTKNKTSYIIGIKKEFFRE